MEWSELFQGDQWQMYSQKLLSMVPSWIKVHRDVDSPQLPLKKNVRKTWKGSNVCSGVPLDFLFH